MGNFSKFSTCLPFTMLLSDYSQITLGDSTTKFSVCRIPFVFHDTHCDLGTSKILRGNLNYNIIRPI